MKLEDCFLAGKFVFFFNFIFIFKLYKIVLVLPNIKMNPPQVYMCSPSWTLLPPPLTNWDSVLKRKDITLLTEVHIINTMVLPVVIYRYESWKIKKAEHRRNSYFWIVVLEKTLESLLESKEITPVHPKGNQSWIFIGRTDAGAEAPVLWPPDEKSWLIWKYSHAQKDWRQKEKATEDEMVRWHHWFNGDELRQTPRDDEGQGSLACCSSWHCRESDTTGWLNNSNKCFFQ